MISVQNVSKAFGPKKLFEDVDVAFQPGRRYGLTGPNGAGKSTFMKILSGEMDPDAGRVHRPRKVGVLRQDHFGYESIRVLDVVLRGNAVLWKALEEKHALLARPQISDEDGHRLAELEGVVAEEDGYSAEADAGELLEGLGIETRFHDEPMKALPGGLKLRVLLAQALFGRPDGLLLDEPTNNLDLDSIRWLELFLKEYPGVLVAISHSGSTKDIMETLEIAKEAGATTIAIVSHKKSPVASLADIGLCVQTKETGFKPEPMSSRIAHLCVIDVLAVGGALKRRQLVVASLQKTRKALVNKRY